MADRRAALEAWLQQQWRLPCPVWPLRLLAGVYGAAVALRLRLYASGVLRSGQAPVPVIVVGNLVAGGAGKTPVVLALLPLLQALGLRPGVISRGHGRADAAALREVQPDSPADTVGDEPLLIRRRGGVPVVVGRQRLQAARALCAAHPEVDVLVCDDGAQHLALARDLTVLVFDDRGAGNGRLLPAGPLREPLPGRLPPRTLLLYSAGQASTALPGHLGRRSLAGVLPLHDWWRGDASALQPLANLRGRRLLAVAGLARPEAFFQSLRLAGLQFDSLPLADHHRLHPLPWPADATDVVLTEKDAVKLPAARLGTATRVWVARLDFEPDAGFVQALQHQARAWLRPPPTAASAANLPAAHRAPSP